jgi:hypothetical protein
MKNLGVGCGFFLSVLSTLESCSVTGKLQASSASALPMVHFHLHVILLELACEGKKSSSGCLK